MISLHYHSLRQDRFKQALELMNRAADGQHRHNPSYVGQRMNPEEDVEIFDDEPAARYQVSRISYF